MSQVRPGWALVAFAALALASPASDDDAKLAATAKALFANVRTETLPNGLRVYLLPVPGSPVVTTMAAYKVGSADEAKDQTGLSHYLEHLLFKGTDRRVPGDIDRETQRNGGFNNASTTEDKTVYYFDFAADRWQAALEIEADRMRNTRIDEKHEFQQEKGAVVAELKGNEDRPWDLEYKGLLKLLYPKASPYSHPVIGEEQHVRGATAEIIKRYYDQWYHPNNAALVVAGGFDPDAAMKRITELFGPIPKGELPERRPFPPVPPRTELVRKEFPSKFDVPRMMMGFNGVKYGDPEDYVFDVIHDILTGGKTSRLYRKMVEGERVATAVSSTNNAGRYPGYFSIEVELLKGKSRQKAEQLIFDELKKLAEEPVTAEELKRVRRGLVAGYIFSRESVHNLAESVATAVTLGDLSYIQTYLDRVLAVTPADIQRVAKGYLQKQQAAVVWSVPEDEKGNAGLHSRESQVAGRKSARQDKPAGGTTGFSLQHAKRVVLPNGLKLLLLENRRLPIVVATAAVEDVRLREPADKAGVAALLGDMLEEGTAKHTGPEIATLIEDVGGSLSLTASGGSVKVLTPDTDLGLSLLVECLTVPTFPAEPLEQKRQQLLAAIADAETQPQNRASNLFNKLVYGDHPFARPSTGTKEVVEKLTAADLKAFHAAAFAPNRTTVAVVGDFDAAEMAKKVEALTAGWKTVDAPKPTPPAPPAPDTFTEKVVTDPTASQTHVYLGHLGITRKDPDYYKLLVLDNVLGTGAGFTDRLSSTLRDRQGLAYTVTARITGSAGLQPGTFEGYIGTFPDKYSWVRDGFVREVARIRDEPATVEEVESAKKYLLGTLAFRLTSNGAVAGELVAAERYGLGLDVLEGYRAAVAAVTPADVQAVARKHLHPKKLTVVAVGPIDADGKPLADKKAGEKKDGGR